MNQLRAKIQKNKLELRQAKAKRAIQQQYHKNKAKIEILKKITEVDKTKEVKPDVSNEEATRLWKETKNGKQRLQMQIGRLLWRIKNDCKGIPMQKEELKKELAEANAKVQEYKWFLFSDLSWNKHGPNSYCKTMKEP